MTWEQFQADEQRALAEIYEEKEDMGLLPRPEDLEAVAEGDWHDPHGLIRDPHSWAVKI